MTSGPDDLLVVLRDARERGFLGPDAPERHIVHAAAFALAVEARVGAHGPTAFLDLGAGAGVPGLMLLQRWADARAVFVDASNRRCAFAIEAAERLGMGAQLTVRAERAEVVGRDPALREQMPVVVARSCAAPAVTAELATAFVELGGIVTVSEPPDPDPGRWPAAGLRKLGFGPAVYERFGDAGVVTFPKETPAPEAAPRRVGVPTKRPLW